MTVVKLIEELQNLPLDAEVYCSNNWKHYLNISEVIYEETQILGKIVKEVKLR